MADDSTPVTHLCLLDNVSLKTAVKLGQYEVCEYSPVELRRELPWPEWRENTNAARKLLERFSQFAWARTDTVWSEFHSPEFPKLARVSPVSWALSSFNSRRGSKSGPWPFERLLL